TSALWQRRPGARITTRPARASGLPRCQGRADFAARGPGQSERAAASVFSGSLRPHQDARGVTPVLPARTGSWPRNAGGAWSTELKMTGYAGLPIERRKRLSEPCLVVRLSQGQQRASAFAQPLGRGVELRLAFPDARQGVDVGPGIGPAARREEPRDSSGG